MTGTIASMLLLVALGQSAVSEVPTLPDPLAAGWKGRAVCEKLHEDGSQRVLKCTFPPGVGHERHFHAPHYGYALAGGQARMTDSDGTREVAFETGSGFASRGTAWHEIVNIGETTIIYLLVEPKQASRPSGE